MEKQIIKQLAQLMEKMSAGSAILSIVNSHNDSLSDKEVLENLQLINAHYSKHNAEAQIIRLQEKYHLNGIEKKISESPIFKFLPMKRKANKRAGVPKSNKKRKQKH